METLRRVPPITQEFTVGATAIQVQNSNFAVGYQRGYEWFNQRYVGTPLTDLDVYRFILCTILDRFTPPGERAGYITGWIEALVEYRQAVADQESTLI